MKKLTLILLILFLFLPITAEETILRGVNPGQFTQDYDAALAYAKANDLPILLNFTGSDWCGWCKLMVRQVFTKTEWISYAEENLVLVTLDFPNDQSIVPEEYRNRNKQLQQLFKVGGYPTYVIIDSDGSTELGRLGASQNKTPGTFIQEYKELLRHSISYMKTFSDRLSGNLEQNFIQTVKKIEEVRSRGNANQNEYRNLLAQMDGFYQNYVSEQLSSQEKSSYEQALRDFKTASFELNQWLATKPEQNDENNKIYGDFMSSINRTQSVIRKQEEKLLN